MLSIHKEEYQYECKDCDKYFDSWQIYKDHKKEEHEKDKPQIKCETCGVTFKYI